MSTKRPEFITVQITHEEYKSLPNDLRHRISRRWKRAMTKERKAIAFQEMMDGDQ